VSFPFFVTAGASRIRQLQKQVIASVPSHPPANHLFGTKTLCDDHVRTGWIWRL